jgi:hypothetical protein
LRTTLIRLREMTFSLAPLALNMPLAPTHQIGRARCVGAS